MADPRVEDWLKVLHELYPPSWAEEWDSTGLQVGSPDWSAARVLAALDPTSAVIGEAAAKGCGLVVAHHPLLFRPLRRLNLSDPVAAVVGTAIEAGVAVAACHTNADVAGDGVSDALAAALDLEVLGPLRESGTGDRVKLVTFVPADDTAKVLEAMAQAGAGVIGEYSHCSFRVRGTGTFLPSERARPAIGERGALTEVEEDRLEVVVPASRLAAVAEALVQAHPYEEVAYDAYPLLGGGGVGLGRLARPSEPLTAGELAERCRDGLGTEVRTAGDLGRQVRTAAVCGGSGASLIAEAIEAGADALVTGDVKHHQALEAVASGLTVIDAGHHGTEWPFIPELARRLAEAGPPGEVLVSETPTNPFSR